MPWLLPPGSGCRGSSLEPTHCPERRPGGLGYSHHRGPGHKDRCSSSLAVRPVCGLVRRRPPSPLQPTPAQPGASGRATVMGQERRKSEHQLRETRAESLLPPCPPIREPLPAPIGSWHVRVRCRRGRGAMGSRGPPGGPWEPGPRSRDTAAAGQLPPARAGGFGELCGLSGRREGLVLLAGVT